MMMRVFVAALLIGLASIGTAQAACTNAPDNAASNYVENGERRSLCLQNEISNDVKLQQQIQSQVDAARTQIQLDMQLQHMRQQALDSLHQPFTP